MQNLKKIIVLLLSLCFIFVSCGGGAGGSDSTPAADLTAVQSSVTENSVYFTWTNPTSGNYVSMVITCTQNESLFVEVPKTDSSKTITGLTAGTDYTFKFRSKNTSGILSTGLEKPIKTAPANPTDVTCSGLQNGSVTLQWTRPSTASYAKMNIYQVGADGTLLLKKTVNKAEGANSVESTTITGLTGTTTPTFTLKAADAAGNESSGVSTNSSSVDTTPPAALTSVTPTQTATSVTFTWTNPTDADYAAMKIYNGTTLVATVNKPTATYTVNNLSPTTTYTFSFKSADTLGNLSSAYSKTITTNASMSDIIVLGLVSSGAGQNNTATLSPSFTASSWEALDPTNKTTVSDKVTVSDNGTVTAVAPGYATIRATATGQIAETTVLVLNTANITYVPGPYSPLPSTAGDFAEYIADSYPQGTIAYKFKNGKIDIIGYDTQNDPEGWRQSTLGNNGWTYKIGNDNVSLDAYGKATNANGTLSLTVKPVIIKEGSGTNAVPYVLLVHALTNMSSTTPVTGGKFGAGADIKVAGNNTTPVFTTSVVTNATTGAIALAGVQSPDIGSDNTRKMVFVMDWRSSAIDLNPVSSLWIGSPSSLMQNIYTNTPTSVTNTTTDSAIAYSWQDITLNPGETKLYLIRLSLTEDKRGSLEAIVW